jgi:lipoyl(octanoyl) transferase
MWNLILTPALTGAQNMALDEFLLKKSAAEGVYYFRLYTWQPWCVSLGYNQKVEKELKTEVLKSLGWDYTRRYTGGRAVLHADEITYSATGPISSGEHWTATLRSTYEVVSRYLVEALQKCGIDAELEKRNVSGGTHARDAISLPCFSSNSRSELLLKGKKLVGSAQRRSNTAFLQHGSLLLNDSHHRLVEVLPLDVLQREIYLNSLCENSVSLTGAGYKSIEPAELGTKLAEVLPDVTVLNWEIIRNWNYEDFIPHYSYTDSSLTDRVQP